MPAFAESHGSRELGGLALASFSAGSLVGGLVAGMRPPRSVLRRFFVGAMLLTLALLSLQLAGSIPTLCLLAFVAGLPIAPTIGALYTLIDRAARSGTAAEAFAWFGTAVSIGIATGSATAGAIVEGRGVQAAFAVGPAAALLGALLAFARRDTLRARPVSLAAPAGGESDAERRSPTPPPERSGPPFAAPPGGLEPPT